MTDRLYRVLLGLAILLALYLDALVVIQGLVALLLAEGLSGFTLPRLVGAAGGRLGLPSLVYRAGPCLPDSRFPFDSERAWRLMVGAMLLLALLLFQQAWISPWLLPWFMGFAIFGAGLSGVCPMLMAIHWCGFR